MAYDQNGTLTPDEYTQFGQAKRRVDNQYWMGQQQLTQQQQAAGNQYQRSLGDTTLQFDRMRERLPWSFGARGTLNSGIYQKALADYGTDRTRALGNLSGVYNDQLGSIQLGLAQAGMTRDQAVSDINEQQAARIASIAAQLRAAKG